MKVCGVNDHVPLSRKTEKMKKKKKKLFTAYMFGLNIGSGYRGFRVER